jgi:ABC-type transporter Mla subunit MlaD
MLRGSSRRDTLLGALIVAGALAPLAPSLLRSIAPGDAPRAKRFTFRCENGRNVKERSPVRMRGLEVGEVESIAIDLDGRIEVRFAVDPEFAGSVHAGAWAALVEPLALGSTWVQLEPGDPAGAEAAGGEIELRPPKTLGTKLEESLRVSGEFAARLEPLVEKADRIADNTDVISRRIEEADGPLGALARDERPLRDIERAGAAFEAAGRDVQDLAAVVERREGALGRALSPEDPVHAAARRVVARAEETLAAFERARARLEEAATPVSRRLDQAVASVAGVPEILTDARRLGDEVARAAATATRKVGSIGRYVNDPDFIPELRRWIEELARSSDTSDHAPINYVTGLGLKPTVPNHPDPQVGPDGKK